jgi:formylglycine-generating enzyme required for sulfatase activity
MYRTLREGLGVTLLLLATALHANDIQVSNPTLIGTNTVNATTQVRFDITWANSWRTSSAPNNWDAAWVFVKYRDANTGLWQHARLGSDAQHSAPAGSTVATGLLTPGTAYDAATNWGVGAFIYRSANGTGTFTANGVELRWNYGQNGITYADIAEVKVFAVEMVYVPQGAFSVGDGGSRPGRFIAGGSSNSPFTINSEAALGIANTSGSLWGTSTSGSSTIGGTGTLPAAFPKGFQGFYVMKYEISQQQYVDFLNTLTRTQQDTRTFTNLAVGVTSVTNRYVMSFSSTLQLRNGIRCDASIDANNPITFYCDLNGNGTGDEAADGQWVACNYLSWADVAAYLDWSGLRPMTELEYEKACRGPVVPFPNEYAWGNSNVALVGLYALSFVGTVDEGVTNPAIGSNGNAIYSNAQLGSTGPGRVGLFAGPSTNRVNAGAAYYGAMELSGSVTERAVSVGNESGRAFNGTSGDGALDAVGSANQTTWPLQGPSEAGMRGGSLLSGDAELVVSSRQYATVPFGGRQLYSGGRGARMVP